MQLLCVLVIKDVVGVLVMVARWLLCSCLVFWMIARCCYGILGCCYAVTVSSK